MSEVNSYIKFVRGQVWFGPELPRPKNIDSRIEAKNRPFLIVSNNMHNLNSPTIQVCPIATRNAIVHPSQVYFSYKGRNQVVLIDQICTIDKAYWEKYSGLNYMYSLNDDIMYSVDKAICSQFDIKAPGYSEILEEIEKYLKNVENKNRFKKNNEDEQKTIRLLDILKQLNTEEETVKFCDEFFRGIKEEYKEKPDDKDKDKEETKTKEENNKVKDNNSGSANELIKKNKKALRDGLSRRNVWTEDNMLQFLVDFDELTKEEMLKKYHIKTVANLYTYKSTFNKKLNMNKR